MLVERPLANFLNALFLIKLPMYSFILILLSFLHTIGLINLSIYIHHADARICSTAAPSRSLVCPLTPICHSWSTSLLLNTPSHHQTFLTVFCTLCGLMDTQQGTEHLGVPSSPCVGSDSPCQVTEPTTFMAASPLLLHHSMLGCPHPGVHLSLCHAWL